MSGIQNIIALEEVVESAFDTDPTSGYAQLRLAARPDTGPGMTSLDLLGLDQRRIDLTRQPGIRGGKGGTFTFSTFLRGSGTPAGNGQATVADEVFHLMLAAGCKSVFGDTTSFDEKEGSTVEAGGSGVTVNVTDNDGANWAAGSGIISKLNGTDVSEFNFVASVNAAGDPDILTCVRDWTADPTAADDIYNCRTIHPSKLAAELASLTTFMFRVYTEDARWDLNGCCIANWEITYNGNELAMITFTVNVNSWVKDDTPGTPAALGSFGDPIVANASPFYYNDVAVPARAFVFNLGNTVAAIGDVNGPQGRTGWCVTDRDPVLTAEKYFVTTVEDDWEDGTQREIMAVIGQTPGDRLAIYIPSGDVRVVGRPDVDAQTGQTIEVHATETASFPGDVMIAVG